MYRSKYFCWGIDRGTDVIKPWNMEEVRGATTKRRSIIFCHIPKWLNTDDLIDLFVLLHMPPFEELFLPVDHLKCRNRGYAFIKLHSYRDSLSYYKAFHGFRWADISESGRISMFTEIGGIAYCDFQELSTLSDENAWNLVTFDGECVRSDYRNQQPPRHVYCAKSNERSPSIASDNSNLDGPPSTASGVSLLIQKRTSRAALTDSFGTTIRAAMNKNNDVQSTPRSTVTSIETRLATPTPPRNRTELICRSPPAAAPTRDNRTFWVRAMVGERETYTMSIAHSPAIHFTFARPWDGEGGMTVMTVQTTAHHFIGLGLLKEESPHRVEVLLFHAPGDGNTTRSLTDDEYDANFRMGEIVELGIKYEPLRGAINLNLEEGGIVKNLRYQLVRDTITFDRVYGGKEQPVDVLHRNPEVSSNGTTPSYILDAHAARAFLAKCYNRRGMSPPIVDMATNLSNFPPKKTSTVGGCVARRDI